MGLITDKLHPGSSIELKISTDNGEEFVNPYRETVIGKWKLQNVAYAYDNEEKKSVEFKDIPVLYEFKETRNAIFFRSRYGNKNPDRKIPIIDSLTILFQFNYIFIQYG
jgi:hypothetical protein